MQGIAECEMWRATAGCRFWQKLATAAADSTESCRFKTVKKLLRGGFRANNANPVRLYRGTTIAEKDHEIPELVQ